MSTFRIEVVPVALERHPNADSLSIVRVFGWTVCVRTADWVGVDCGAYICPDSIVPDTPQFAFLGDHRRIKVKKLRGVVSQGLLVPAPAGSNIGDDVAAILGVTHYDPPLPLTGGGEAEAAPCGYRPTYDVEGWFRYRHLFVPGEPVVVTEKIHGCSSRFTHYDGRMRCGSRTEWKKESESNLWWRALRASKSLEPFCRNHLGLTVYGEVYGQVQDLKYGKANGEVAFAAFDILNGDAWFDFAHARHVGSDLDWVPLVAEGEYEETWLRGLADGKTLIPGADHMREGIVIKPKVERTHPEIGRVQMKIVSDEYLARAD